VEVVVDKVVVVLDISSCNGVTQLVVVVELVGQGVLEALAVQVNLAYLDHLVLLVVPLVLLLRDLLDFLVVQSDLVDPLDQEGVVVVEEVEVGAAAVVVVHMAHLLEVLLV